MAYEKKTQAKFPTTESDLRAQTWFGISNFIKFLLKLSFSKNIEQRHILGTKKQLTVTFGGKVCDH